MLTGCSDRTSGTEIPPLWRADRERAQGCAFPYTCFQRTQDRQGCHRCSTKTKTTGTIASSRYRRGRDQWLGSWNYQPSGPERCIVEQLSGGKERNKRKRRAALPMCLTGWRGVNTPRITEYPKTLNRVAWHRSIECSRKHQR